MNTRHATTRSTNVTPIRPLLELRDIARTFTAPGGAQTPALRGVSLTIEAGEFIAIVGPSGSGKSTLMRLIGCLDKPSAGTYHVAGGDVSTLDDDGLAWLRRDVFGFVFQDYGLLRDASVLDNVLLPTIYTNRLPATQRRNAIALLHALGLGERLEHKPGQLSGGQQQRVSIARAMINQASVILADEPTGALDSQSSTAILDLLEGLAKHGRTVIVVTHDQRVAARAERRVEMLDGRVSGDTGRVWRRSAPPLKWPIRARQLPSFSQISQVLRTTARSLRRNPMRTALTLLGVVIGVASVVTMLAIGEGAKQRLASKIDELGASLLTVIPDRHEFTGAALTFADVEAIRAALDNVRGVLPEVTEQVVARRGNVDHAVALTATTADYPLVRNWALSAGTFFTDEDSSSYAPVAVLGASAQERLFPDGANPLGAYVLIGNVPFLVIGTLTSKGTGAWGPSNRDDSIFVPLKTGSARLFGHQNVGLVSVVVDDSDGIGGTERKLRALLTERHGRADTSVLNSVEMQSTMTHAMHIASLVLAAIGAIALLVGGIGIMNIMLVSVFERTREVGIRMATGARAFDILVQFLLEALLLCLLGGAIGTLLGFALGKIVAALAPTVWVSFTGPPTIAALLCALATGLVFGYLPARRASRLHPGDALAHG